MAEFDDLRLEKTPAPATPPPPRWLPIAAAVVLLIALAAIWYYLRTTPELEQTETSRGAQAARGTPQDEPAAAADVPALDQSDAYVRDLIRTLSQHPIVVNLLTTDQLIRTFAVSVMNLAEGETPSRHLYTIKPEAKFQIRRERGRTLMDPRSYSRYDAHAAAVDGIDPAGAARVYDTLQPRIEEAYREVAGANADFDRALERAIVKLLETPVVEGDIAVKERIEGYAYADPSLESLSRAQQHLLRMGPENMRIVQEKLRVIARELGLSEGSLPRERVIRSEG